MTTAHIISEYFCHRHKKTKFLQCHIQGNKQNSRKEAPFQKHTNLTMLWTGKMTVTCPYRLNIIILAAVDQCQTTVRHCWLNELYHLCWQTYGQTVATPIHTLSNLYSSSQFIDRKVSMIDQAYDGCTIPGNYRYVKIVGLLNNKVFWGDWIVTYRFSIDHWLGV